jgi:hypothetical protein
MPVSQTVAILVAMYLRHGVGFHGVLPDDDRYPRAKR